MTESRQPEVTATISRHEDLWISDGNVVLSAVSLDGTRTTLFRVHRSLLSKHSEVFTSMFNIPQGRGASELYEGIPLVRLPDASEDVESLFSILHDPL